MSQGKCREEWFFGFCECLIQFTKQLKLLWGAPPWFSADVLTPKVNGKCMRGYLSKCGDEWTVLMACWIQTVLSLWGSWAGARDHLRFYSPQIWLNNNPKLLFLSWKLRHFQLYLSNHHSFPHHMASSSTKYFWNILCYFLSLGYFSLQGMGKVEETFSNVW